MAANVGTWMHDVGAVWLMTSLTPSPLMVARMPTATSLPFFLLALPAGALADVVDRRRFLLATQGWMMAAAVLGVLALLGVTTPGSLLALTFALVTGALATLRAVTWLYGVMFVGGGAWIALMSSDNAAAQAATPAWGRARALAVYLLVLQGEMAAGSALWGAMAARTGIPIALLVAGAGLLFGLLAVTRYRLPREPPSI